MHVEIFERGVSASFLLHSLYVTENTALMSATVTLDSIFW